MQVYLVGGAVRDSLLNYPFHEHDWVVVGAEPQQLLDKGYQQVGKDFPVFLHPETKEEYALARTERKSGKGYAGFECYSAPNVSLEQDLQRRDLTINAIAQDQTGALVDPYNGQQDIHDKVLRHVSDAFIEDPLRVLRTARFYARYFHLGFSIAAETLELMQQIADNGELEHLSQERVWAETEKALNEDSPEQYFIALYRSQALARLFPMLAGLEPTAYQLIKKTAQVTLGPQQRFALLFSLITPAAINKALKSIKVPNDFSELAQLVNQHHTLINQSNLSATDALDILKLADAYRRPERFEQLLTCCEVIQTGTNRNFLLGALELCQSVDAKAIAQQGLKGPEIAQALHQQRLSLLSDHLTARKQ